MKETGMTVNGIFIQYCCPTCAAAGVAVTMLVGEEVKDIRARWGPDADDALAEGEVLERAVKLACLAHPDWMENFECGDTL
jgi:hypothetical protein